MTIKILIGADICPTRSNYELFAKADTKALIGDELSCLLDSADYTIFNLETPLTDDASPIVKTGPCLIAPVCSIAGLKAINPHFFTLANNHILDQGVQGLNSTINILQKAGIAYAGVGPDLQHMQTTHEANVRGIKLGIYCCAEHEFSIATDTAPGANPYDPLVSFDSVRELKKTCDAVVVLYHGGKEHYRYPSPQLQRVFHKFAECGADLVIAQHTHCIGCMEKYQNATLIYGQGNFLFDGADNEYWNTNVLIELNIEGQTKKVIINYIPCVKKGTGVRRADPTQTAQILADFEARSQQILSQEFVKKNYLDFSKKFYAYYLQKASGRLGRNLFVRTLNKLTGKKFLTELNSQKNLSDMRNLLECESWYESFLTLLKYDTDTNR